MPVVTRGEKRENDASLRTFFNKKRFLRVSRCINIEKSSPYWRISYLNMIKRQQNIPVGPKNTWDRYNSGDLTLDEIIKLFNKLPIHDSLRELYTRVSEFKEEIIFTGVRFKNLQLAPMINVIDTFQHNKMMSQHDLVEFAYFDTDRNSDFIYKIAYIPSINRFIILYDYWCSNSSYIFTFKPHYARQYLRFNELINTCLMSQISSNLVTLIYNGQHLIGKKIKQKISDYELCYN